MSNKSNEELTRYHNMMTDVIHKCKSLIAIDVPYTHWIACQQRNREEWYGVLAVLGTKPNYMQVFFTFEELDAQDLPTLALQAFEQLYGYLPDSQKDKMRHYDYWTRRVNRAQEELNLQIERLEHCKLRQAEVYSSMGVTDE